MVTVDHLRLLFTVLRRQFDFCILDISSHLGDATLEVIEESDRLLMITSGRLPSLKDTKRLLKVMADLGIRADRISIIWNRMFGVDLRREVVEASIKFPVATELPAASEALLEAITDGVPLVLKDPRSSFARALKPLAQTILGDRLPTAEAAGSARAPMKRLLLARGGATA
jgi:pilus assembly protein CpaE